MIVTTGRSIKIQVASYYHLERNAEGPGIVTVRSQRPGQSCESITLPANEVEMEAFIAAYRRAASEDVGYRKQEVE